jgi:uncharacterized protein YggE
MSNQQRNKDLKSLMLAGVIAAGIFASAFGSMQMLGASAQEQNSTGDDKPIPVDLNCETGVTVCEQEIEHVVQSIVSTSGTATVKVTPDKVSVTIGVETDGSTAEEAAAANADLMDKVIAALKNIGIPEDQISTNWYSVYPVYSQISANACRVMEGYPIPPECYVDQKVTSYRATNSVTVTMDADKDVGKVIDNAVSAGATNVNGAYFFVSSEKQEKIRSSLIADAIANARSRADKAANAVEMNITGVKSINLNDVYFPVFYKDFAAEARGAPTQILSGQQEISQTVQVTFIMS